MRIANVEFMVRKNKGNYEHEEIKLSAIVEETDDYVSVIESVKLAAHKALYGDTHNPITSSTPPASQSAPVSQEAVKEEVKDDKEELKKQKEAAVKAAAEAKAAKEAAKAEAAAKSEAEKAAKATDKVVEKYDPTIKEHTDTLASHLNKLFGDSWKADKVKAKQVSRETLVGLEFRNKTTGEVLPSFIAELNKHFGTDSAL